MRHGFVAFSAGALIALVLPAHPPPAVAGILVLLCLIVALGFRSIVAMGALGLAWACLSIALWKSSLPASESPDQLLAIVGRVTSFPTSQNYGTRFYFERIGVWDWALQPRRLRVVWYRASPPLTIGAVCRLHLRVERSRSALNPGSTDQARSAAARGEHAWAYVVEHPGNLCWDAFDDGAGALRLGDFADLRARIADYLKRLELAPRTRAILLGLTVAYRGELSETQWDLLRVTGVAHLLAISGLHIGLAAWLGSITTGVVLALSAACSGYPRNLSRYRPIGGLCLAAFYAGLAGFSVPTQRALVVVVVIALIRWRGGRIISFNTLLISFAGVLLVDPLGALSKGFWLSFAAVTALVAINVLLGRRKPWWRALMSHIFLSVGLAPVTAVAFGHVPVASAVANFIAVPWCSFVVVPLCLAGGLGALAGVPQAQHLLTAAGSAWEGLEFALMVIARWDLALAVPMLPIVFAPLALAALVVGCMSPGRGAIIGIALCLLLTALPLQRRPAAGQFVASFLDVGQGAAAVIQTRRHTLVFDVGPQGTHAVRHYLEHRQIARIDRLVLSHADHDHIGDLASLGHFHPSEVIAQPDKRLPLKGQPCSAHGHWRWEEVDFEFLYPWPGDRGSANDKSCVLKVTGVDSSLLLTGDIERLAESTLVRRWGAKLKSDVLFVPHHGSKTSSTEAFIKTIAPRHAVVSAGFNNRFGFPAKEVLDRYVRHGVQVWQTSTQGAVTVRSGAAVQIDGFRHRWPWFWRAR
ncbi:MAG: DNA internalization-related competence protein ComEC/Rec2 [Pseudomonadota bacterium]